MRRLVCLACFMLATSLSVAAGEPQSRSGEALPSATGSISGRVTVSGRPIPGLVLALQLYQPNQTGPSKTVARAETDSDGMYLFLQIPAGNYHILPLSPHLILDREAPFGVVSRQMALSVGEALEKIGLALVRGGVITGKILDSDGNPLIGEMIDLERVDPTGRGMGVISYFREGMKTDDRGIYRLFGLYPGRYRVLVGMHWHPRSQGGTRPVYHPGTHEVGQAAVIEVKAGEEVAGIDIKLPGTGQRHQIAGRVIDVTTGAPLPYVQVGYGTRRGEDASITTAVIGGTTDERGEFRFLDFPPGEYFFYAVSNAESDHFSELTRVEMRDGDVDGVVVKTERGSIVSGWVTIEGAPSREVLARLSELQLHASRRSAGMAAPKPAGVRIDSNGRFIFKGLPPGKYGFFVDFRSQAHGFNLVRIERNGAVQEAGIDLVAGKDVKDLRLVIAHGTGSIRGRVKPAQQSVGLPVNAYLLVSAAPVKNADFPFRRPGHTRADRRGNFAIEGLVPGKYELSVTLQYDPLPVHRNIRIYRTQQVVVVKRGESVEVELPVEIIRMGQQ